MSSFRRVTFRAWRGRERLATAVTLKAGGIYQVYPSKAEYASVDAWKAAWPTADRYYENGTRVDPDKAAWIAKLKKFPPLERRREQEFAEFLDPDYSWLITCVRRADAETLELKLNDGSTVTVKRCTDYLAKPPRITREAENFIIHEYTPALTAVRYLMMVLFMKPEV